MFYSSPTKLKNHKGKTPLELCSENLLQLIIKHQKENEGVAK